MLWDFQSSHPSISRRAIYIVCAVFVLSYILFDVLDLDGSDFPRPRAPVERNVVVAEVPKDIELAHCLERAQFWLVHSLLDLPSSKDAAFMRLTHPAVLLPLDSARLRGHRAALPRSSPSDPF
ncbi:MAG TPA: hypothetical protein VLX11_15460 [Candidatus Acidoferrales bacterium]|nr:hypothetical protein [Candidatus Acidoferrales bacterium]